MDEPRPNDQAPAQPPAAPPPAAPKVPARPQHKESIKETIESILIAFILAFVFRAFVVEAFVIPSGSMAPTLLGAHMRFNCEQCGWQFDVNYPGAAVGDTVDIKPVLKGDLSAHCPNCGFKIRKLEPGEPPPPNPATDPFVHYGDRILVLKYLYLLKEPRRWDVVVFKSPSTREYNFSQNFIKRLVGRPGETIMLLDGDVYACPNEAADALKKDHPDDWVQRAPWQVQAKHEAAQQALWRIIYDNDYFPRQLPDVKQTWKMPWTQAEGSGWTEGSLDAPARIVRFDNASSGGKLQFDRNANAGTYPFTDWLPYNESVPGVPDYRWDAYGSENVPRWNVSDLCLKFACRRQSGDGPLKASITKLGHRFTAELTPSAVRLMHERPDGTTRQIGADVKFESAGKWVMVELQNVDYAVALRIDGRTVLATTRQDYAPDVPDLLRRYREQQEQARRGGNRAIIRDVFPPPSAELQASSQTCEVGHLSLWRDIYYTPNLQGFRSLSHSSPERPVRLGRFGEAKTERGTPQENEYFVLGDNSILSGDARDWRDPVELIAEEDLYVESGRVPQRFMLGKAFFVYWPAGYRPTRNGPGVIPNFGEMRFIH